MSLRVREGRETDKAFVMDAWRRSFEDAPAVRGADRVHFRSEMERTIGRLFRTATVRVACDPADEDTIVGFAVFTGPELHYVYVKQAFRKMGIARQLLEGLGIKAYTFRSNHARPVQGWQFTPRFTI